MKFYVYTISTEKNQLQHFKRFLLSPQSLMQEYRNNKVIVFEGLVWELQIIVVLVL